MKYAPAMRVLLSLLLVGCGSTWTGTDNDGDGYSIAQGDCYDNPSADLDGVPANLIHPGATETWYDGVDSNCDGANDFDQDGDGHLVDTFFSDDGSVAGDDCWDGPASPPPAEFTALLGFYQPLPQEVYPGVAETWYDGVDSNCDGSSDFDQDGDGFDSQYHHQADGSAGADCLDAADDVFDNPAAFEPGSVNPDEVETWYDGTDANCDELDDYDQDQDGTPVDLDCDDLDENVGRGGEEIWYDGPDEDCSGGSDYDQDGDGHDSSLYGGDDCIDVPGDSPTTVDGVIFAASRIYPEATDTPYDGVDANCLGDDDFDADSDGQSTNAFPDETGHFGTDCNDSVGYIYLGATEIWYDGIDEDCSGGSDYDQDGDDFDAVGYAGGNQDDCDDGNKNINPDMEEDCSTVADDNCSGGNNDQDAVGCDVYYADVDGDGYGDLADSECHCDVSGVYDVSGTTAANDDCNDASATVSPGITIEDCGTTDDDCDGTVNEQNGTACTTYYADVDGDGYGHGTSQCWCSTHGTYSSTVSTDCDDAVASTHPGATEVCDYVDQDCDGATDEGITHYYTDADGDGYGDTSTDTCTPGGVTVDADCDDADERVYPGAPELCDLQQNDCSASSWAASDEYDTVSYATDADVWSDVTAAWDAGTAASPVTINTASTGSYFVCPGTWYVGISATAGDDVDILGQYGALVTTLSRNGVSGTVVNVADSTVKLTGLKLTGGLGAAGGGSTFGGGVFANGTTAGAATVTLTDCDVTGNTATSGGGINAFGFAAVTLDGTDVHSNTATTYGGGLYIQKGSVTCLDGGVYDNTNSGGEGGGAYMTSTTTGTLSSTTCDWTGNSPDDVAGAHASFTTKIDSVYGASATFSCVGNTGCTP